MELQEFLDQEIKLDESFKVTDNSSANWTLRKIKELKNSMKENSNFAYQEIKRYEDWEERENGILQNKIDHFESLLAKYAMDKREEDPKFKSKRLPHGYIGFRKKQAKWNYQDDVLLETLKKNQLTDFINVTKKPDKEKIKKTFSVQNGKVINPETGEVIEGITVEEQGEDFNVKVSD